MAHPHCYRPSLSPRIFACAIRAQELNVPLMLDGAQQWHAAGCSIIPVKADGSKSPLIEWRTFQRTRATDEQVRRWFSDEHPGIGVVCGHISGNLEMLEFEGRAVTEGVFEDFVAKPT